MSLRLAVGLTLCVSGTACEKEELGQACGTVPEAVENPVGGETPVIEVVRVERDSACESFQCLTHHGLPPYCTRPCELDSKSKSTSCTDDIQCKDPQHCEDGFCTDDDCPNGYWCRKVQDVGPLANSRYCVVKTGCQTNIQCEDLGEMSCNKLGCFDVCLRDYYACDKPDRAKCDDLECYKDCLQVGGTQYLCRTLSDACKAEKCFDACTPPPGATCDFHRLVCEPFADLSCQAAPGASGACQTDIQQCADKDIECRPDATLSTWPAGTVKKLNACLPK